MEYDKSLNLSVMTLVKNSKDYVFNGERYFVEQYADKPHFVWFWRYGKYGNYGHGANATIISDMLRSRPNLKRLFGA